ncbi:MAG: type III-B CRISPR module-associated protein Cmr5 [Candidatus Aminicenantes bacterium]|nr:type III-B CRISPR module-associated protein Cmr5 [Candidatus Aminicenantes bacterium]
MRSLQQIRAKNAFKYLKELSQKKDKEKDKEKKMDVEILKKLPVMLQTNGLLATWAFLLGKEKKESDKNYLLSKNIEEHLKSISLIRNEKESEKLLEYWTKNGMSFSDFSHLTDEAIQYAVWLKRAAEAYEEKNE